MNYKNIFRFIIIIIIIIIFLSNFSLAQKEGNIWYFGNYAGVDFNNATGGISNCLSSPPNYESNEVYLEDRTCRRGLPAIYYYRGIFGIEALSPKVTLKLYPNPSQGIVTLEINNCRYTNLSIEIINILGQIIFMEDIRKFFL